MKEILLEIIISAGGSLLSGFICFLFCLKPYQEHKKTYAKIMALKRNYKDPKFTKPINPDIGLIEKQGNDIIEIINRIDEMIDLHSKFAWFFDYKMIRDEIWLLFEYNRNPIMLKKQKIFEDSYTMDIDLLFNKIKKHMNFQKRVLFLFIIFSIIVFSIVKKVSF